MIVYPNCKINLGLSIKSKRNDGFHELETIFYPVQLTDILEIISSSSSSTINVTGLLKDTNPQQNLVFKAYNLLKEKYTLPQVKIHLHKLIPDGAGLGGGSADAAYTIKLLNDIFQLQIPLNEQQNYASILGSDCAFFILNEPVLAHGRGEVFSKIKLSLKGYSIILIKPPLLVSTKDAYSDVIPNSKKESLADIIQLPIENWKTKLINQFEETIFPKYPVLNRIKDFLYSNGAMYVSMSGSGSTIYGIFKEEIKIDTNLLPPDCFIWQGILG